VQQSTPIPLSASQKRRVRRKLQKAVEQDNNVSSYKETESVKVDDRDDDDDDDQEDDEDEVDGNDNDTLASLEDEANLDNSATTIDGGDDDGEDGSEDEEEEDNGEEDEVEDDDSVASLGDKANLDTTATASNNAKVEELQKEIGILQSENRRLQEVEAENIQLKLDNGELATENGRLKVKNIELEAQRDLSDRRITRGEYIKEFSESMTTKLVTAFPKLNNDANGRPLESHLCPTDLYQVKKTQYYKDNKCRIKDLQVVSPTTKEMTFLKKHRNQDGHRVTEEYIIDPEANFVKNQLLGAIAAANIFDPTEFSVFHQEVFEPVTKKARRALVQKARAPN
jgi:hypothetical protein